jgi:hypothetical protein
MHIALVLDNPVHPKEHMTLVWMGKFKLEDNLNPQQEDAVDLAGIIANLINRYIKVKGSIPVRVTAPSTFGGTYVARVAPCDNILFTFRELCERLDLNKSQYEEWRPHISAPRSQLLRASGSFAYIVKAELR